MESSTVVGEIAPDPGPPTDKAPKVKLARALPTDRVSFEKQLLLLRCFAIGAGVENKPVTNATLADLAKLNVSTAGVNNTFYADAGLTNKAGMGYTPAPEVVSFERAFQFNPETAGQKLAPVLRRTWFGQALLPKLAARPYAEDEALGDLADVARAQPEHKAQLRLLLDYLALGACIERDGLMIRQGRLAREDGQPTRGEETAMASAAQGAGPVAAGVPQGAVNTSFAANPNGPAGGLSLAVNISVDMKEMATWPPNVVTAFMAGLAQVITAKAAAEASATR